MPKLNILFVGAWFATATTALFFALIFTFYLSTARLIKTTTQSFKLYAALPKFETTVFEDIEHADARTKIIENFFKTYKSPLSDKAPVFIAVADKYQLDWRLLPAISMQESNGGKRIIKNSNNPFGYGIYGSLVLKFVSWEEAIERVGKALREDYLDQGLKTPTQIMAKYTPPSLEKGGAWAKGVTTFMEELR
jgi:hypothetical protein